MRSFRFLPVLAVSLTAAGALSPQAAVASQPLFTTQPTCTVTISSRSSSSTTCTGAVSKREYGVDFLASVDVTGVAVYQCEDSVGAIVPGQPIRVDGNSSTAFTSSKTSPTFTTDPAVLAAPSTTTASQTGCADGSMPVNPALTTTAIQLLIAGTQSTIIYNCTASDPTGLDGVVSFTC